MSDRSKTPPRRPRSGPKGPKRGSKANHQTSTAKPGGPASHPSSAVRAVSPNHSRHKTGEGKGTTWFYGVHTVLAALNNPKRAVHRVIISHQAQASLRETLEATMAETDRDPESLESVDRADFDRILPDSAVHQGIAALVSSLPGTPLEDLKPESDGKATRLLILDQANDPQNIGAVIRTAAAFGALAVIVPDKNTPPITPAMAKAASGGLETVPLIRVTNLVRALYTLKDQGFWCIGLDADGAEPLSTAMIEGACALVMGAEGKGLRRLTAQACDSLASIPISSVASLNVSVAAAIALYESVRDS